MSQHQAFASVLNASDITFEEGTVKSRIKQAFPGLTEDFGAAKVNGPAGDKGQYVWMGTYVVQLDRGITLPDVQHLCLLGNTGSQDQRCIPYGEKVVITWLNRKNVQLPVILEGVTVDFYNKQLFGNGHLLDPGERIIRSAIAALPPDTDAPFADNQFDNPASAPNPDGSFDENLDRVIRYPGSEIFFDKFGRLITLSRSPGNEYLVTCGRTDTGQDDVSDQDTVAKQDTYYDSISDDESEPVLADEPMAPKPINLTQYMLIKKRLQVEGDPDPNRTVTRGILPRFDRWKFQPIVIRSYDANKDGTKLTGDPVYAVHQERQNTKNTQYGFIRTITDSGDLKIFVPRHANIRVVGDALLSVKGNVSLKVKPTYGDAADSVFNLTVQSDGTTNVFSKNKIVVDVDLVDEASGPNIFLGGEDTPEAAVKGETLKDLVDALYNNLKDWVPVPSDGGMALKTLLLNATYGFITKYASDGDKYLSIDKKVKVS